MANVERVTFFKANLEDKSGALLTIMQDLKSKNVGLVGLWGYSTSPGNAELYVVSRNPEKIRNAWKSSGKLADERVGFMVKGTDRTGALVPSLKALADAGVNIDLIDALAVGGKYASFIWVAPNDADKAAKALGAK